MPLIDLPTELLDEVFSYLDWDRTQSLTPVREDLTNASLTCRHLRKVLEPAIFRCVTLRLCWEEGTLIEPRWYRLRKERPEIAKYVRCVFIRTGGEQCMHCNKEDNTQPFVVPEGISDWLSYANDSQQPSSDIAHLRPRVDQIAQRLFQAESTRESSEAISSTTAEELVRMSKSLPRSKGNLLNHLAIVMLCIPASTNTIILKANLDAIHHKDKNQFSHRLFSTAMEVFHDKLQDLSIISNHSVRRLGMSRQQVAAIGTNNNDSDGIHTEAIQTLTAARRLVFATSDEYTFRRDTGLTFVYQGFERWTRLSPTVRELDLRYIKGEWTELLRFIKGFENLKTLRVRDCKVSMPFGGGVGQNRDFEGHIWLTFAIEIRRALQHADIELHNLYRPWVSDTLPVCTVDWILTQAIPPGVLIDVERSDRLLEDFVSFLPLWYAEDGDRGSQAMHEWSTQRGPLSDEAMTRRWR